MPPEYKTGERTGQERTSNKLPDQTITAMIEYFSLREPVSENNSEYYFDCNQSMKALHRK